MRAIALHFEDAPVLQTFFERNPEYYKTVGGQPPAATEADEELNGALPAGFTYTRKGVLGVQDQSGEIIAAVNIVSDLFAPRVWLIGLFIVATHLHGSGKAQIIYAALERWMKRCGAHWLRLGVVAGNTRGERFWSAAGFTELRVRSDVVVGAKRVTMRVMVKPLGDHALADYLDRVPRDHPD